jgi:tetratricopeptide (TPR) repeat protein
VCLIPQVDEEGREIAGIHLPEVRVPLATFMGWSLRSPTFSHTIRRNAGTIWPLPHTEADRKRKNDPRMSILERYSAKSDYLAMVAQSILELRQKRFLLDEDVTILLNQAAQQSDWIRDIRFIEDVAIEEGSKAGFAYFNKLRDSDILWWYGLSYGQFNNRLNSKGYSLMREGKLESALEVFKLNSMIFTRDYNVWDSLAECYYKMKEYELSKKYYEKSLKMNPDNTNAKKMLENIKKKK